MGRVAARRRTSARTAVLPARRGLPDSRQLIPSVRSIVVGLALLVLAVGAYLGARETSVFAVQTVEVRGGTPALRAEVGAALAGEVGTSLMSVDEGVLSHRLAALPDVRSFTYDRAFPHTLRVVVRPEVPVLVVRRVPGADAFLVAGSGKVIRTMAHPHLSNLPRLWVKGTTPIAVGAELPTALLPAATTLAAARGTSLPGGIKTVSVGAGGLVVSLGGGLQIRLGDDGDVRLKLAIARRILAATSAASTGATYLDVSVPQRPVLGTNSQVGG